MNGEIIQRGGKPFAVIPEEFFNILLDKAEELEDIKDFDQTIAEDDESIPAEVVYQLLDGENKLKVWRNFRDLTQAELSKRADITQAMIAMIETGKRVGKAEVLRRLAEALNIDVDDLI